MKIIHELLEMAKFTKHNQVMGLTSYENANYVLAGGMRSGSSSAGTTRLKYVIYDMPQKARKFWEKVGVEFKNKSKTDGRIIK